MTNFVNGWPVDATGAIVTSGSGRSVAGYLPEGTMPVGDDGGVLGLGTTPLRVPEQYAQYNFARFNQMTFNNVTTGATVAYDQSLFNGGGGVKITPTATSVTIKRQLPSVLNLTDTKTFQIGLQNNNPSNAASMSLVFYFSADFQTTATDWVIYDINLRGSPIGKDEIISIDKATRSNQSASFADSMWSTVRAIGFNFSSQVVSPETFVLVRNLVADSRFESSIFLSMDQSYASQVTKAIPLLEKYGLHGKATIFMRKDTLGSGAYATISQLQTANQNGYPIGLHTFNTLFDTTNFTAFPDAASITTEINGFHEWASSNGLKTVRALQPIANNDPFVGTLTQAQALSRSEGYAAAGVTRLRRGNQTINAKRMNNDVLFTSSVVHTFPLVSATTNADIDEWLQIAIDRQELISVYWHDVKSSGATGSDCNVAQLDYLLQRVAYYNSQGMLKPVSPHEIV